MTSTTTGLQATPKQIGPGAARDGNWQHVEDVASSRMIHVQVDLEMQSLEQPVPGPRSYNSIEELIT